MSILVSQRTHSSTTFCFKTLTLTTPVMLFTNPLANYTTVTPAVTSEPVPTFLTTSSSPTAVEQPSATTPSPPRHHQEQQQQQLQPLPSIFESCFIVDGASVENDDGSGMNCSGGFVPMDDVRDGDVGGGCCSCLPPAAVSSPECNGELVVGLV